MSLSKMHFEHMAEHIGKTASSVAEVHSMTNMAHSLGRTFNPNYDQTRMESTIMGHMRKANPRLAEEVAKRGSLYEKPGPKRVSRPSSVKKMSSRPSASPADIAAIGKHMHGMGGGGDEPRDDHGRWTK